MPDFDKDLNPILPNTKNELPILDNPATPVPRNYGSLGGIPDLRNGMAENPIFGKGPVISKMLPTVSAGELYANRRYATYDANIVDIEDQKAYAQSGWDKAANGVLKGLNLTGTTIAGGFGMLYGAAKSPFTGRLADIWDNEIMRDLDDWNNEVDQVYLPNYYTNVEKEAAWYSTDNWFRANFLFDKLIKNSGFAVGAMLSGNIANAGLLRAGSAFGRLAAAGAGAAETSQAFKLFTPLLRNTARAFSAGKNIEAAAILEGEISSIADVTAKSSKLADIAKTTNAFSRFGETARRTAIAAYSSAGEASFEALQTAKEYRNSLIEQYKSTHFGEEPIGADLAEINRLSETVGKTSFFGNLAILGITEYVQLPKLLGSSYAAERQAANNFVREAGDVIKRDGKYIAAAPTTRFGKIYSKAVGVGRYIADPKEGLQEGLQYALQVGTQNYFKKAYQSKDADAWVDGFLYGFVGVNEKGEGVGAFNSKEGAESILLGTLTGGLMQAKGNFQKAKAIKSNTEAFVDGLNKAPTFRDAFKERLASANRGVVLQEQQQDAVLQGDKLEAKDLDADMLHNYLVPRIKYGRMDMFLEDIKELQQMGISSAGLASLKEQGLANIDDSTSSYQERLSHLSNVAKNTAEIYKSFDLRFSGEVLKDSSGNPILDADGRQQRKYSPLVIDKMVYAASKIADYDLRIPKVNLTLAESGIATQEIIDSIIKDNKPNKEATAKALNEINALDVIDTTKDDLKTALSDVIELSLRRKLFVDEHNDIKKNPLNYDTLPGYEFGKDAKDKTPVDVIQKELDAEDKVKETTKKLQIGKEYSLKESIMKDGTKLTLAPKITVLSQTLGGELEVKLPNGKTTFLTPEEFKKYKISDQNNTSQEMANILDKAIDTVLKEDKYAEVKKEMPKLEDGKKLDKVAWINSLDNQSLIDDVEKEFNKQTREIIEREERRRKEIEKLKRNKEAITKQQGDIVKDSGDVGTNDPTKDVIPGESALKDASILFISGTTESEGSDNTGWDNDPSQSPLHIRNSREFLNNAGGMKNRKNMRAILVTPELAEAYGLNGLVQMSYGKPLDSDVKDIDGVNDVDRGFIAQVFVEQVGDRLFFIDKEGNQIGEVGKQVENINNVIFQTMPTTKLTNSKNEPRYRKDQKEEAEAYAAAWKKQRALIFATDASVSPTIYQFDISRGIPYIIPGETNHIAGILIDKKNEARILATDETIIQIPTTGVIAHKSGQINMPNGRPILVHNDNVQFLNNIKFKGKRALAVYEAIRQMAEEINEQSKAGKRVIINKKLSRFLQNVLYWRLGKTQPETNQINIAEDGSSISFAGNTYSIPEITERKDDIIEAIEKAFHNVNNKSLSAEMFQKPFEEYYIDKDGKLSEEPRVWANYQTYLLSSTYPDGSARSIEDTPLSTNVSKPDSLNYTHRQKYATLIGLELPVGVIAKPEKKAEPKPAPKKERKYDYDGETDNIFSLPNNFGDVIFVVKEGEDPKFDEEDDTFIKTRKNIIKSINAQRVKAGKPELSEEELIPQANGVIETLVKQELEKDVVATQPAGEQTITTKFGDVVFTIDQDGDPVIDENNVANKATIKKITDAVNKVRPDASKDEISSTVDATLTALINNELGKKPAATPTEAAPVSTDAKAEVERKSDESVKDFIGRLFSNKYFTEVDGKQIFSLTQGRWGVVVNVNGIKIPFYQSTSGTDTKVKGQWYPFFGDLGNWVIKGNSDDSNIGYGFKAIQNVQKFLNDNIKETDAIALSGIISTEVNQNKESLRKLDESKIKGNEKISLNKEATAKRLADIAGYSLEEGRKTKSDSELFELASKKIFAELAALEGKPTTDAKADIETKKADIEKAGINNLLVSGIVTNPTTIEKGKQYLLVTYTGYTGNASTFEVVTATGNKKEESVVSSGSGVSKNLVDTFINSKGQEVTTGGLNKKIVELPTININDKKQVLTFLLNQAKNKKLLSASKGSGLGLQEINEDKTKVKLYFLNSDFTKGETWINYNDSNRDHEKLATDFLIAKYDAELAASEGAKPQEKELKTVESAIRAVFGFYDQAKRNQEAGNKLRDDEKDVINDPLKYLEKERDGYQNSINEIIPKQIASLEASKAKKNEKEIAKINEKIEENKKDLARYEEWLKQIDGVMTKVKEAIASSEGAKSTESPKEPGSFDVKNVKKRGGLGFRKVSGLDRTDRMTEADIKAFKEWHAKNVPFIPFEVLEKIINVVGGEKAWGVFENGVAKFVRGGLRGTEYHEIGEAIWNGMLTSEEKQALIAEFRNKPGQFTDRETGKKYNHDDLSVSDNMVKERILDDFADYRLGKLPARTLGEAVRKFFKMIMDFFKSFVAKPSLKQELFKAIDTGKFKDRQLSAESKSMPPQYRAAGHLTEEQTNAYVKDMTGIAAAIILGNGSIGTIDKSAIYDLRKLTSDDVFNKVEEIYTEQGLRQEFGDITWKDLVTKTKQELKVLLKIDFNEEDLININEGETNKNDYAREPFSIDYKKSAPTGIKFVSATLLERVPTNQENSNSFKLPDPKVNPKTETYSLLPYTRVFSTMIDKLKNTTSIGKAISKIVKLANQDANYVSMFQRLGGNLDTKTIDFSKFKMEDWRLFIEMMQTYTKQKPNAVVQYISQGQVYSGSAIVTGIVRVTTREWIQNMRSLAKDPDSLIKYDSGDKTYYIQDLSKIPTSTPEEKVEFLKQLGIIFPIDAWKKLKEEKQKQFTLAVASLKEYLQEAKDIMNIQKRTLDVAGQYDTLAELLVSVTNPNQENTRINLDGRQTNSFTDNNTPSVFENEFNEVETLDELLKLRPELNDLYSRGAQLLKKGGKFFDKDGNRTSLKLQVGYIEGTKNVDENKGTTSVKLTFGNRLTQEINQNVLGNYYILVPADGSTEWMMNLGNTVSFEDIEQGKDGWKQINKIFRGYLTDDVALALDADNRKQLKNVGNKAKDLRFFKDILSEKMLSKINEMIAEDSAQEDIEKYIDDNIEDVNASIKEFIEGTVTETKDLLLKNGQMWLTKEGTYTYPTLDDNFTKRTDVGLKKNKLTEDDVTNLLTFVNANYIINNIELHKVIFGDPYQFAIKSDGSLDETKRIKSFLSPRRTTFDSPELNTFLNDEFNKAGDVQLQPGEPGYQQHKAYVNTVTASDVNIVGSVANMKNVSKEVKSAFAKTNEADAASFMMDGTYRELKIKNAQWSQQAEDWHQWQMAWTRQNLPSFKYSDDARGRALEAHDKALLKTKEPKHTIEIIKPIVSGAKSGSKRMDIVLDKFSQMPIYYSMVKGTNLEKLYLKMMENNIGYTIMISGRKVGAEALYDLYTPNGEFNDAAFNNNIEVSWKSYGIQVETTYEGEKEQTRGSQLTKLSTLDLYENGEPIGANPERKEAIAKEAKRNKEILDRLHKNGYERFLKRLGIEDLGGSYRIADKKALAKTLQDEMFRRELSDNVKDSIQLDEDGEFIIPFEASPAYLQIKSILYSFIDKSITSPKMNGGSYVQTPVTLWENAESGRKIAIKTEDGYKTITTQDYENLSDEDKRKVVLTDDTLKFYEDADGKRYCEVMLPNWFKLKLGKHSKKSDEELIEFLNTTDEGRELLSGVAFRIPTQSLSSVEVFKVKGFLPQYMGKTVVVPSEITTKAGSDFDIDKLSMYLKSVYVDKRGEIRIVRLMGSEESTREFYAKVFDDKLEGQKLNRAELMEAVDIFTYQLDDPKNLVEKHIETIESLMEEVQDAADVSDELMRKLEKLGDKDFQESMKQKFVDDMYKRALENEYYDSLEKLVALPENFQRLISPVSDDGLKQLANKLDEIRGYDETKIKNRLLNRNYMTSLRHAFIIAKKWVGIAAVNITGHSLTQKFKAYIDPERFNNVPLADRKILRYGNGEILLDHNKLEKDGRSYISLSGRLDAIGKFISDGLSGFASSFVDVAKDPYILKIIKSDLAVGTFMFLRRVGVPKEQLAMFMNQPIIEEYLTMLDNKGVKTLFDSRYINAIKQKFPTTITQMGLEGFNKNELEDNIKSYYETKDLGDYKNHEQQNIFLEFLKYAKMAEYSFKLTQASNYDTTKFQSGDSLSLKQWRTETAKNQNIISSVGELLENNFIGVQAEYLDKSMEAMGAIFPLEQDAFVAVTDRVLKSFSQDMFLSKDKFDRIANKIKAAFLDYIIQKRSDVATNLQAQLVDTKTSVAQMLVKAKKDFPGVQIIEELQVDGSGRVGGAETVKLRVNDKTAYGENMYQGMMRELRDDPRTNELYEGIVKLAILQGTYQSPISIKNIIPVEDYAKHISPIISGLQVDVEIEGFATSYEFQRNEWQDNDVVPIMEPRFREMEDPTLPPDSPRRFQAAVVKVGKRTVSGPFPTISGLDVKSTNRQILLVNSKYQAKVSNYDVIKVPRAVPIDKKDVTEGKIDVATGLEITNQTYAEKIKKGDTSLRNYYGYQKVKYADGSPVIADYDREGNPIYVYKFINLHGDGMYAAEYYGDGRPSVFNNGSQKNIKNVEGTIVSNEIPDQTIINYYGGEPVPLDEADPITATIENESESENMTKPAPGVENIPNSGLTVDQGNQFIDLLQPQIANQAYIENKARTANMMFSFGLRWARNIPNETEKSEQGKNLGKPRPNRKQIKSKEGMTYGYYLTDQNNKPLPSIKELQPIMDFIQSKLGIDMSDYDAMLGNIYDNNSFIHQHRDTTESVTAKNYPVIVINLGADGHLEFDRDTSSTYATYQKSGQLDLTNGGIYAFGVNGESRFTFHHRIGSGLESANPLKPITLPNGQVLNNYRITLTFRRASDLEPGMPTSPNRASQENITPTTPTQPSNVEEQIYSQLGDRTVSGNIELLSLEDLRQYSEAIDRDSNGDVTDIVSIRMKNTFNHFGNPFDNKNTPGTYRTRSTKESVLRYINWVLTGETGNTLKDQALENRRQWILSKLRSGELKGKPILYYTELNEPSHATALDYLINKYNWSQQPTTSVQGNVTFEEDSSSNYQDRTKKNASADATIAIAVNFDTPGEKLTRSSVKNQNKQYIPIEIPIGMITDFTMTDEEIDDIVEELNSVNAKSLNIAGNGIYDLKSQNYTQDQIDNYIYDALQKVLNHPNLKNKITSIRSGGQTGIDEAGAKAGMRLGIPTTIRAPKGWKFRNISGTDISNEQQFKARFNQFVQPTTSVEGQVAPEVIYKDKEKRIRIDYPAKIRVANGDVFKSSDLVKISEVKFDGSRIAEQDSLFGDYSEAISKKYGEAAGDYVGETNSEISIPEAEFLRDNPEFAKRFIDSFLTDDLADGKDLQQYAQALLDQNEKLVDTAQGRLFTGFDTTNEFTDAQKNKILANFGAKHKMNVEKAREYINQAMAEEPQKTIDKLKECYL